MSTFDDKLSKIVELARSGEAGERDSAIEIVKRICAANGLDYSSVMEADAKLHWFDFTYKTSDEKIIIIRSIFKATDTATGTEARINKRHKKIYIEVTAAKGVEVVHTVAVYLAAFRAERKKILDDLSSAFVMRNSLWSADAETAATPEDPAEAERLRRQYLMALDMDEVVVSKAIESGKNTLER